jgi:hypothetical protein
MAQYYSRRQKNFINSRGKKVYVEVIYPKKTPAPAIIVAHGLRSYYPGFLDMFAKSLVRSGYVAVKFHFLGTGKSEGKFEDKSTGNMLQNLKDVIVYVGQKPEVKSIGIMGRSNGGSLAVLAGPQPKVKAYIFLASPAYYSQTFKNFLAGSKKQGRFFYHPSFKRRHTKGAGRLPFDFFREIKRYDQSLLDGIKKIKQPMIYFQSTKDEAVLYRDGHFDYYYQHWAGPKKLKVINGGNHSFKNHKRLVISETLAWLKKSLPIE